MKDIYLATKSEQPDHTSKLPPAYQQEKVVDQFHILAEQQKAKRQWACTFDQLIDAWDDPVFQALDQLAQLRWPPEYLLGLIPASTYRLRDEHVGEAHYWWVEHDIPPQDQYQCAAYQVCLILDKQGRSTLTLQSGTRVYPVSPMTVENFQNTLAKAGQDPPLIIPRNMGKVDT